MLIANLLSNYLPDPDVRTSSLTSAFVSSSRLSMWPRTVLVQSILHYLFPRIRSTLNMNIEPQSFQSTNIQLKRATHQYVPTAHQP